MAEETDQLVRLLTPVTSDVVFEYSFTWLHLHALQTVYLHVSALYVLFVA